jgi:putative DNA primase/helicase
LRTEPNGQEALDGLHEAWHRRARELARWAWERLVNRVDVWGSYNSLSDREKVVSRNGSTTKLGPTTTRPPRIRRGRVLLTETVLVRHFSARGPEDVVGLHSTSPENTSLWGALDLDAHCEGGDAAGRNLAAAMGWYARAVAMGFRPLLSSSNGAGGYHLRLLLREAIETARIFFFLYDFTADFNCYGYPKSPELFPKQSSLPTRPNGSISYGNWLRVPGRHHTRDHWSQVWDGGRWLEGDAAIDFMLSLTGDDPGLVPLNDGVSHRVRSYLDKLPRLCEGEGRDNTAYVFAAFLAKDMALSDAVALPWLEEWDGGNSPPLGRGRLCEIMANARLYGRRTNGSAHATGSAHANGKHRANGTAAPDPAPPAGDVREAANDPHRLARLYLAGHVGQGGQTLRWWREQFHRWQDGAYRTLPDKEVKAELSQRIKREFDDLSRVAPASAAGKVTTRLLGDVMQALMGMTMLPGSVEHPVWLGGNGPFPAGEVLAFPNTLLHLPSWAEGLPDCQHQPTPKFFSPNCVTYDFSESAPPPDNWLKFLDAVWPGDQQAIDSLQEFCGYCLLPDTSQHKILFVAGPKRSGKGTIARVLRELVGSQNTCSPTLAGMATNFGMAPLLGKTLAVISDARLSGRSDAAVVVERLLSISGEDAQTVDRKHLSSVTVKLPTRFVVLTNELPRLSDSSGALVGRLIVLRMTRSWFGREDTGLTDRLLSELPGILLWALEGWKRLRERGRFRQPDSGRQLIQDLEDLSSPTGAFVRERCEVGPGFSVPVKDLYGDWKSWCEEKGRDHAGDEASFGRNLRAALPQVNTRQARLGSMRLRFYEGLRLRASDEPEGVNETPFV